MFNSNYYNPSVAQLALIIIDSSYIENSHTTLRDSVIAAVVDDQWEEEEDTLSGQEPQGASSSSSNRPLSPPGPPPRKRRSIARAEAIASQQPKAVSISAVPKEPFFPPPRSGASLIPREPQYPPPGRESSLRPRYLLPDYSLLFVWGADNKLVEQRSTKDFCGICGIYREIPPEEKFLVVLHW